MLTACSPGTASTSAPATPATVFSPTSVPAPVLPSSPSGTPGNVAAPSPAATHSARVKYPSTWVLPDRKLSPGAIQPGYTIRDICPDVNPALEAMRPSTAEKNKVYAAYGITSHRTGEWEIDHVDAVEILGLVDAPAGDPTLNLYPERNDTPDPAMLAKYHLSRAFIHNSKDILEDVLHEKVCAGTVPLATAQHDMAADWRAAYAKYVGPPPASAPYVVTGAAAAPAPVTSGRPEPAPAPVRTHSYVPPATHSAAPVPAACYPKTSGGNCYRAGEFCRKSDLGTSGVAGNGERIRCEASGSRNRWEPA